MKSHYYLAQSLLPQRHTAEALVQAKYAYSMCLENRDSSAELISQFILKAKQAAWQGRETARLREMNETLALVEDLLNQQLRRDLNAVEERFQSGELGETGRNEEKDELEKEAEERRANIRKAFEDPAVPETAERVSGFNFLSLTCKILTSFLPRWFRTGSSIPSLSKLCTTLSSPPPASPLSVLACSSISRRLAVIP